MNYNQLRQTESKYYAKLYYEQQKKFFYNNLERLYITDKNISTDVNSLSLKPRIHIL